MNALAAGDVDCIAFDYGVEIRIAGGSVVRIEGPAKIRSPRGDERSFDPEAPGDAAVDVLKLLHRRVVVRSSGSTLIVDRESKRVLEVDPSEDFEAWTVVGADGSRVVCGPGGEMTTWSPA